MSNIIVGNYNNYFNRKVRKEESVEDYITAFGDTCVRLDSINFNPNDRINTELILGVGDYFDTPDYLVVFEEEEEEGETIQTIISRWFVLSATRTRGGQYSVTLKRDVIADNLEDLLSSPLFVQKGMLPDSDPMILNDEGMKFNQIKTSETLLKDKSNSAWIVGYMAKSYQGGDITVNDTEDITYTTLSAIASAMGTTEAILSSLITIDDNATTPVYFTNQVYIYYPIMFSNTMSSQFATYRQEHRFNGTITSGESNTVYTVNTNDVTQSLFNITDALQSFTDLLDDFKAQVIANKESLISALPTYTNRNYYLTDEQYKILSQYDGSYILYNGNYYQLRTSVTSKVTETHIQRQLISGYPVLETIAQAVTEEQAVTTTGVISLQTTSNVVRIQLSSAQISGTTIKTTISSSRKTTLDQACDLFAIPFNNIDIRYLNNTYTSKSDTVYKIINQIGEDLSSNLYDLQLLPYCPMPDFITSSGQLDLSGLVEGEDYNLIQKDNATITLNRYVYGSSFTLTGTQQLGYYEIEATITMPTNTLSLTSLSSIGTNELINITYTYDPNTQELVITALSPTNTVTTANTIVRVNYSANDIHSVILFLSSSRFQTQLDYSLSLANSMKIDSQCDMYRLVSPNYQGTFEFNVAKNGGSVDYFTAYCTYKPYTPFIKITPAFNFMYGADFNDGRGLICGGDFSLPRLTSAWETYQLNNKNYQNIFNRDVQNLDFEQNIQMRNQMFSSSIGALTDTVKGAGAGALVGGGVGAIVGGVVSGSASIAGGIIDTSILASQQREQRQLAIDKYNYQLGNIQALPYTLTKIGAFDISSKVFPFLEYYTCTDEEKEALENKIKYESCTVMRIDYLGNYYGKYDDLRYVKGVLIRNDEVEENTSVYNAIYEELLKGVYM